MSWTIASLTTDLSSLTPWSRRVYWWGTDRTVLQNPTKAAFCRQAFRLARSVGVGVNNLWGADTDQIDAALDCIEGLANESDIEWSIIAAPYHYVSGSAEVDEWGTLHRQEMDFVIGSLRDIIEYILAQQAIRGMTCKVGLIYLDTEVQPLYPTGDALHDKKAVAKIQVMYGAIKSLCDELLPATPKIVQYDYLSMNLVNGVWRHFEPLIFYSGVPTVPLYTFEDFQLNTERYDRSLALAKQHGYTQMIPIYSLNAGFVRDWNVWQNAQAWPAGNEWVTTSEYPRVNSWLAGRAWNYAAYYQGIGATDEYGKLGEGAPYGLFWPGPLVDGWKYQPVHFAWWCYGAMNWTTKDGTPGGAALPSGEPVGWP